MKTDNLVPVYYGIRTDGIIITSKAYCDVFDEAADGANGENGKVYPEFQNEPYNYFTEINDAMWSIGCQEMSEAIFDMAVLNINTIISKMKQHGFELIHNPDFDNIDDM